MEPVAYADAHAAPKEPLSLEAFLRQYDDAHAEWVNGEVVTEDACLCRASEIQVCFCWA
jgi:hypothetical protein